MNASGLYAIRQMVETAPNVREAFDAAEKSLAQADLNHEIMNLMRSYRVSRAAV